MAVDPKITILLDLYGELLTERERETLNFYYNEDLSLREIADNETQERRERFLEDGCDDGDSIGKRTSITRQGVRDTIKRAESKLLEWDSKLHLSERAIRSNDTLDAIVERAKHISEVNLRNGCIKEISDTIGEIISLVGELYE